MGAWTLLALLDEFASSSRSVVGLSWEYHHTCQQVPAAPPPRPGPTAGPGPARPDRFDAWRPCWQALKGLRLGGVAGHLHCPSGHLSDPAHPCPGDAGPAPAPARKRASRRPGRACSGGRIRPAASCLPCLQGLRRMRLADLRPPPAAGLCRAAGPFKMSVPTCRVRAAARGHFEGARAAVRAAARGQCAARWRSRGGRSTWLAASRLRGSAAGCARAQPGPRRPGPR